ncbi:MAG: DUF4097 domain-containing protein [Melioribacteraceae bacterium]|nr:DUF4097 domain-containing protein [Melioribacteraceae bacterium]
MFDLSKHRIKILSIFIIVFYFFSISNSDAKDLKLLKEKSFDVKSGQLLTLKTDAGDVIIKTWEKQEALVKIYGDRSAEQKMEFSFDQDENGIYVIGEKEGGSFFSWFSNIDLKFEIIVPHVFDLDLKTSGGDIMSKNIEGDFTIKTSGGDIYIKDGKGILVAGTSGGDITLHNFSGGSDLSTSGGDIEVDSKDGKVFASTSGGDIVLKASNGPVSAKTSGGDITLKYNGDNNGISLVTSGGDIDVVIPSNLNADVELKTSGGELDNNFSNNKMSKVSKTKLEGKFNNGGSPLICKTSGGDISIREK